MNRKGAQAKKIEAISKIFLFPFILINLKALYQTHVKCTVWWIKQWNILFSSATSTCRKILCYIKQKSTTFVFVVLVAVRLSGIVNGMVYIQMVKKRKRYILWNSGKKMISNWEKMEEKKRSEGNICFKRKFSIKGFYHRKMSLKIIQWGNIQNRTKEIDVLLRINLKRKTLHSALDTLCVYFKIVQNYLSHKDFSDCMIIA